MENTFQLFDAVIRKDPRDNTIYVISAIIPHRVLNIVQYQIACLSKFGYNGISKFEPFWEWDLILLKSGEDFRSRILPLELERMKST